jgi:hypothetical protein
MEKTMSAFEPTPEHELTLAPPIPARTAAAIGRLLPPSMIAFGAVATLGWVGLLFWLALQMVLAIV